MPEQPSHPPVHFTNSAMEFHSKRFTILVTLCHTQEGDAVSRLSLSKSSMTCKLIGKPTPDLIFTAAVAPLRRCDSQRLGPKHDALKMPLPRDKLSSSRVRVTRYFTTREQNSRIFDSPASTSSMKQRKGTARISHHHGRTEKTQPGSRRSLAASFEVSGDHSAKLRKLLNDTDQPFKVETSSLSRKKKRNGVKLHVQRGLFEERLDVQYEVDPLGVWKSLRGYKRFTGRWWPWCYSS